MIHKYGFDFRVIYLLSLFPKPNYSTLDITITSFAPYDLVCNFPTANSSKTGLNLSVAASICRVPPNHPRCFGVKCDPNTQSNCQLVSKNFDGGLVCVKNYGPPEEPILIARESITFRDELALVDMKEGYFITASIENPISFSIPPSLGVTTLQTQWGNSILSCSSSTTECRLWHEGSSELVPFPSLMSAHDEGTLDVVGDTPVVIGGKNSNGAPMGAVEIYDHATKKWVAGPALTTKRASHASVVLNDTHIVVVGGLQNAIPIDSVKVLNIIDRTWSDLIRLNVSSYGMACGLAYESAQIFCAGGSQKDIGYTSKTYSLEFGLSNEIWRERGRFNIGLPVLGGFLFQLRNHLYCMTTKGNGNSKLVTLRRIGLYDDSKWIVVKGDYDSNFFANVMPYITSGHVI